MVDGDQILRSFSLISSLKESVPDDYEVEECWVKEFHNAVEKLEHALNIDLDDFKVSPEYVARSVGSYNELTGETRYLDGRWCKRSMLLHKIVSILTYFTGLDNGQDKKIGFEP